MAEAVFRVRTPGATRAARAMGRLARGMRATVGQAKRMSAGLSALGGRLLSFRGLLASAGVYTVGRFVRESMNLASGLDDATAAFERLAAARGLKNGAQILRDGAAAMDYMISKARVASMGVRLFGANTQLTGEQLVTAMKYARWLSDKALIPMDEAVEKVTGGLTSMHSITLKGMLLNLDAEGAVREHAKALGVQASALSFAQRSAIKLNLIIDSMKEKMKAAGDPTLDAADKISQLGAAWEDLKTTLVRGRVGEILGQAAQGLTALLRMAEGEDFFPERVEGLSPMVERRLGYGGAHRTAGTAALYASRAREAFLAAGGLGPLGWLLAGREIGQAPAVFPDAKVHVRAAPGGS